MQTNERERARRPRDGAQRAPSPYSPRGHVIPAKAGTYWRAPRLRESGNLPYRANGREIPAYAGMTAMGAAAQEKASPYSALCYHSPVAAAPAKENNATQIP